jgi:hypothetical protein
MLKQSYPYIGDGFYRLTDKQALAWCHNKLPREGHEKIIKNDSGTFVVARTKYNGEIVWSVRIRTA